ncbi:MAG TPA: single-stranded-DNA-specific exonuclease RecJ [Novimethylophilus sp.]|jgi:single-stranded-DNA-specific exonuclease|uniref:single-stranded-DNA-specific exonuclease RecJ n=1 Tax=Novimethylophilus sp. TaxID=2137426 RepID=UPI002F3F9470
MTSIVARDYPQEVALSLTAEGLHPVLARVYAARGITRAAQLQTVLAGLIPPAQLRNADQMAALLADAIAQHKKLLIVADYDSDGATACAVGVRGLRLFGATVDYLVPNRFDHGYGLTPEIVRLAAQSKPDIIITVDNGIASVEGVAEANRLGIAVLVTDHHLQGDALPDAVCIVNPNAHGCTFPSKNLAGVGVIFYVMLALRAELRQRGRFADGNEPNLTELLDLVALGTVADVVRLDDNNRILVDQGLRRIRAGKASPGVIALLRVAGRDPRRASTYDLGFVVGPRLNAAGRLEDMALGIECLLAQEMEQAQELAGRLDAMNRNRREIESDMQQAALAALEEVSAQDSYSLSLYDPEWHQGVIGILASRLKEKFHRPVITFAPAGDGKIKGSGRSIPGLHLRDALDLVSKRQPDLLLSFGGHAMAAGLSLMEENFPRFAELFEQVASELLTPADLEQMIETDGLLAAHDHTLEAALAIDGGVWGQGFATPAFHGEFAVAEQRVVGERHLKLKLRREGQLLDAMLFFQADPLPAVVHAVYQLGVNEYNGQQSVQLTLRHWNPA